MSLMAKLILSLRCTHTKALDLNTVSDVIELMRGPAFTDGSGANQADTLFHDQRTLADAANETLDLHDGSLSDAFGDALTLDKLKGLYVKNYSTEASLLIGGAATTPVGLFGAATDVLKLPPGGEFLFSAPDANGVDVSTNSDLKLEHDGTGSSALNYDIIAVGVD